MTKPDFRALLEQVADEAEKHVSPYLGHAEAWGAFLDQIGAALEHSAPEPIPFNCWLDDDYPCPSACVFDDPAECITNCTYAAKLEAEQRPKTSCRYYKCQSIGHE
jgi:hypothetical protein